jgi:hypothetical protein
MGTGDRQNERLFRRGAVAAVVACLAACVAFNAAMPQCGPVGQTFVGRIYFWVPVALLVAQAIIIGVAASLRRVPPSRAAVVALVATAVSFTGEVVVFWAFFAAGGCDK